MDLIDVILYTVLAYWVGKFLITWLDTKQIIRTANTQKVVSVLDKMIREVKEENHHGYTYWFDKENDRFLGQGETLQEVIAVIKDRFPDNVFLLPNGKVLSAPNWTPSDTTGAVVTQAMFDKFNK